MMLYKKSRNAKLLETSLIFKYKRLGYRLR